MTERDMRFVVVASTNGSVMNQCLSVPFFRRAVHSVITDRPCLAEEKAKAHGAKVVRLHSIDNDSFCERLLDYLSENRIDYVLSFYTNFYSKPLRDAWHDRIVNLHPSILPAFKGMDGFGDQIAYHSPFIGSTVELIDEVMDEGKIVMQALFPRDPAVSVARLRHRLFVQQCRCLLQVVHWLAAGRVLVQGGRVVVADARHDSPEFSPALDADDALAMDVPEPEGLL